jgi:DNA-binding NtrC family response regulator
MQETIRVLVVDDEEPLRRLLKKELGRKGFPVEVASDGGEALNILRDSVFDVLLLDIVMPGIDGIELLNRLKADPASPVIKPYKLDELVVVINRAFEYGRLTRKNQLLEQELVRKESPGEFICRSGQMKDILGLIRKIAPTDSPVLVQGESGTGKELVANTLWHYSRRSGSPFVALNCATLSEHLIESEIFGHEKGAFTNAYQKKHGLVEVADRGTLFLDEIGDMPLGLQAKLLRFLDSGEFRRLGSNKTLRVDVRLIAATNKELKELVKNGDFREDLYYRLNVINITIPPLRERKEDIPELALHFLGKYGKKMGKHIEGFKPGAMAILNNYPWPGNARELENVVERAVILCDNSIIGTEDLSVAASRPETEMSANPSLEEIEKDYILRVLKEVGRNQSKASQILGIDRKTLYLKLKKYGIGG